MLRTFISSLAFVFTATAAQITDGFYSSSQYNPPTPNASYASVHLVTADVSLFAGDDPTLDPFFPVRCNPNDAFAGPCTILAGTPYSVTYTNLNYVGLSLTYNGTLYNLSSGSCAGCYAGQWALALTYTPLASFTYGVFGVPGLIVPFAVTGSLTVRDSAGTGYVLNNYQLSGSSIGRLNTGSPGPNSQGLVVTQTFITPEPASVGLVLVGLVLGFAARRRREATSNRSS